MDLHRGWSQRHQFVRHVPTSPLEHGREPDDKTLSYRKLADVNVTLHDVVETSVVDSAGELAGTTLSRNKKRSAPIMTMFSSDVLTSPLEHGRQPDDKTKEYTFLADVHVTLHPEGRNLAGTT